MMRLAGAVALLAAFTVTGVVETRAGGTSPVHTVPSRPAHPAWHVLIRAGIPVGLSHPAGLAIDPRGSGIQKWMYVADTGNNRIVKVGTGGRYLGSWGTAGSAPGQLQRPEGVAVDRHGNVYVADSGNNRVEEFGPQGRFIRQWGAAGTAPGQFDGPTAVAVGGSGNVFVADRVNRRIEKFSGTGTLLAVWPVAIPPPGQVPPGYGPAGPYRLAVDARGTVYDVVDTGQCSGGHCVMDYDILETRSPSGTVVHRVVGGNPYGGYLVPPGAGITGVGPWWMIGSLTVDARGHIFLGEWNPQNEASVTQVSPAGKLVQQWELPPPGGAQGWPPLGLALDPQGNVYAADTFNRILKLQFQP